MDIAPKSLLQLEKFHNYFDPTYAIATVGLLHLCTQSTSYIVDIIGHSGGIQVAVVKFNLIV